VHSSERQEFEAQEPVTIKKSELMESSEGTSIKSTDKNTIPVQAGQVGKIETIPAGRPTWED